MAGVRTLLEQNLVTGMKLDSKTAPDPICEPCLAGKMHANPFSSSEWHASRPLELVHTDVHYVGDATFSGFKYWITFIDDFSRFCFILPLKAKSDAFEAFKTFKAFAENQSEQKIKILCDDKGGEYMSNSFADFTTQCRILRQHTVRNCP
jgi:Integrase core domain